MKLNAARQASEEEVSRNPPKMLSAGTLPLFMLGIWRAHLEAQGFPNVTLYVQARNQEEATKKARALAVATIGQDLQEDTFFNLTSASELVEQGVSDDVAARIFETGWYEDRVTSWVERPIFCVRRPELMTAAWLKVAPPIADAQQEDW